MTEARSQDLWGHTSSVLALIANVNRDPKKSRPFSPKDFNPHAARRKKAAPLSVDRLANDIMKLGGNKSRGR